MASAKKPDFINSSKVRRATGEANNEKLVFPEVFNDTFGTRITIHDEVLLAKWSESKSDSGNRPIIVLDLDDDDLPPEKAFGMLIEQLIEYPDATEHLMTFGRRSAQAQKGAHQTLYISCIQAHDGRTAKGIIGIVASICQEFGIMPDFLSYLYRLGPFTQDNLAYNSFRNGRISFSCSSAYAGNERRSDSPAFEVCYLLKLPRLTVDTGILISEAFAIAHMAVYCYIERESSTCVVMEDSTHAVDARSTLQSSDRTNPKAWPAWHEHLALYFFILSLRWWNSSLDQLEKLVYNKGSLNSNRTRSSISSLNTPVNHPNSSSFEVVPSVVTLQWLKDTLQATGNAMTANLLNLRSLGYIYQGVFHHHETPARFQEALQSITGEAERQLRRAEQLQSHVQGIAVSDKESRLQETLNSARSLLLDQVKLQYISLNYSRGISVVFILLLPGIFVSTLLSTPLLQFTDRATVWLAFALPLTAVATLSVLYFWRIPIIYEQIKSGGYRQWFARIIPIAES